MAEKITYYAMVDEFTSREQPKDCPPSRQE